jgi:sterol 3beta-glucosyltransferase
MVWKTMKILLISIGTRGDMEPFLAIGEIIKEKGHQVICAFPEQFRLLAEESELGFVSLGSSYIEMLESDLGKAAMGTSSSGWQKFSANIKLASHQTEINRELVHKQYEIVERENPDRILYNGKVTYPIIWGLNHIGKNILVCPLPYIHFVREHAHVVFNGNYGPLVNKLTYSLADFGMVMTVEISAKWLNLPEKLSQKQLRDALSTNKAIYTISPTLFARPDYWPENIKIMGFHERKKDTNWRPDEELTNFLDAHQNDRILFITFGSMTNPDPEWKTKVFLEILERNKIPAILNTASGGLIEPGMYDKEQFHFVSRIPYDWIFPRMYGVIHHGGSGTTHLALRYGCPSLIIPHIIDQFVWDQIVSEKGFGPKGIKINKITTDNLEPKICELVKNSGFKERARQGASQMKKENFREEIYRSIIQG